MRDLAAGLYEICPSCHGRMNGCRTCWDDGIVLHQCGGDDTPASLRPCSETTRKLYEQEQEQHHMGI